jgi:hypothetical protein
MMRTRLMMRAQPSRIIQMHQQRFMGSFKPTARVMSPVPVCTDGRRICVNKANKCAEGGA